MRQSGLAAPIILCVASYRFGETNPEVRAAQRDMVDPANGILAGPDTDALGPELRHDDCHFSEDGQRDFARLLAESLAACAVPDAP